MAAKNSSISNSLGFQPVDQFLGNFNGRSNHFIDLVNGQMLSVSGVSGSRDSPESFIELVKVFLFEGKDKFNAFFFEFPVGKTSPVGWELKRFRGLEVRSVSESEY